MRLQSVVSAAIALACASAWAKFEKIAYIDSFDYPHLHETETAEGFLSMLSSVWAASGLDYFISYDQKMQGVKGSDVRAFVEKYIEGKNGMFIVFVSPRLFKKHEKEFAAAGYQVIDSDNAFWWKKE